MLEVEESKPIISKMILKKSKVGDKAKVETETSEIEVNLRWGSSIYRYDIIDNFRQTPTNIFFKDLVEIEQYRDKLKQYIDSVEKRKANEVKNLIIEEKLIYRSYVKLE